MNETHFDKRCRQRGIYETNTRALHAFLMEQWRHCVRDNPSLIQFVCHANNGASVFRFYIKEGMFYAVMAPNGRPLTVYDRKVMRDFKASRRKQRKLKDASRRHKPNPGPRLA